MLAVFNLLPAFPLDGGRVLRSILWGVKGDLRWATRIAASIGSVIGIGLIVLGWSQFISGNLIGGVWWFLIGMFIRSAAQMSYQQVLVRKALDGEPVSRFMNTDPVTVPPSDLHPRAGGRLHLQVSLQDVPRLGRTASWPAASPPGR